MSNEKKQPSGPLYGSFLVVFLLLVYSLYFTLSSTQQLISEMTSVDTNNALLQRLQEFTVTLRNAEAANNAYVLLGKERHLKNYFANVAELKEQMDRLQDVLPNAEGRQEIKALRLLIEQRIEDMNLAAEQRETRDLNHALQIYLTGRWQHLTELIQERITALHTQQKTIVEDHLGNKTKNVEKTMTAIFAIGSAGIVLFLILALIVFKRVALTVDGDNRTR